jgi:hypothetical protein
VFRGRGRGLLRHTFVCLERENLRGFWACGSDGW